MKHAKLNPELIQVGRARDTTFRKRKSSLFKKISEFQILCDVDACVITYGPSTDPADHDGCPAATAADIWPPNRSEVCRIIRRYEEFVGQGNNKEVSDPRCSNGGARRTTDRSDSYRNSSGAQIPLSDARLNNFNVDQFRELDAMISEKLLEGERRIHWFKGASSAHYQQQQQRSIDRDNGGGGGGGGALGMMELAAQSQPSIDPFSLTLPNDRNIGVGNNSHGDHHQFYCPNTNMNNVMINQQQLPMEFNHPAVPLSPAPAATPATAPNFMLADENTGPCLNNADGYGYIDGFTGATSDHVYGCDPNLPCLLWNDSDPIGMWENLSHNNGASNPCNSLE